MGILEDILGVKSKSFSPGGGQAKPSKSKGGWNLGGESPYSKASDLQRKAKDLPSTTRPWQRPVNTSTAGERATEMYKDVFGSKGNLHSQEIEKIGRDLNKARVEAKLGSRFSEEEKFKRQIDFYNKVTGKDLKK